MQTQQPGPIPATMPLQVTLEAQQWNQIMTVLYDTPNLPLPHRLVAPLVQSINDQLQAQAVTAGQPPATANGLDRSEGEEAAHEVAQG